MALGYTLNKNIDKKDNMKYFTKDELELMTTFQLREICNEQQIINGITSPLDKDELIYQILRFRGREDKVFITKPVPDGRERVEEFLSTSKLIFNNKLVRGCAKLICYEGLATEFFDNFTIGYDENLVNTNAILVSGNTVCAIFQIVKKPNDEACENLYITKSKDMFCYESNRRNYRLYCMDKANSDLINTIYNEELPILPEHIELYMVEVLDFQVKPLIEMKMPLAIDFGTSNTTAGLYLDDAYFEQITGDPIENLLIRNDVNYLYHVDSDDNITPTLPTVIGITEIDGDDINYIFGHEANRLFNLSHMNDGFSVFYDIKRFVSDPEKQEEVVDKNGHRTFIARKELVRVYLEYIISIAKQRFKCDIKNLHISAPVKQKKLFIKLFLEILSDYTIESEHMLDEGVSVLYNSISELIARDEFQPNQEYKALIIDCGGGTTDLSSCTFSIESKRVSYKIDIKTAYENGDTDFGGNNLTYRIMQLVKIGLAYEYSDDDFMSIAEIMQSFDLDLFREVDEKNDVSEIYELIDKEYEKAELVIPTKFKNWEHLSRSDYYAIKNNFYYLFDIAERIKTEFYKKTGTLRIALSSIPLTEIATSCVLASRWKLFVMEDNILTVKKDIPTVYITIYQLNLLLKSDIYAVIKKFMGDLYETDKISEYAILRLTGQSCKIDIFREALKEFIPGKMIQSSKKNDNMDSVYALKLICLNGAIKYLKDVKYGYADVNISSQKGSFPYIITAITHENKEKELINGFDRKKTYGYISRNMSDLTLKLFLKDINGNLRYTYSLNVSSNDFNITDADTIVDNFKSEILQDDLDDIIEREMKFFILPRENNWGFSIIPVFRFNDVLHSLEEKFYSFETDGWLKNFFDGTR